MTNALKSGPKTSPPEHSSRWRRIRRWGGGLLLVMLVLAVVLVASLDAIVRTVVEKELRKATGLEITLGQVEVGLLNPTLRVEKLVLSNRAEFGGGVFLEIGELSVTYDRAALWTNAIHLQDIRLELAELSLIQNTNGQMNWTQLMPPPKPVAVPSSSDAPKKSPPWQFLAIDHMALAIDRLQFTSQLYTNQNFFRSPALPQQKYKDIKTLTDLQAVGMAVALQTGVPILFQKATTPTEP